jgi:hypothetical protein
MKCLKFSLNLPLEDIFLPIAKRHLKRASLAAGKNMSSSGKFNENFKHFIKITYALK